MKSKIITPKATRLTAANARRMVVAVKEAERMAHAPEDPNSIVHERIVAANAAMFVEANFSEALTNYARGWRDPHIEGAVEFYAPRVDVSEWFQYEVFSNIEEFFSDSASDDDLRAIKGDFKEVEYTSDKITSKTENRGLRMVLDYDQIKNKANWQQYYTAKLLRRIQRNKLRRAIAILSAAATNTAKTWDSTAGKDPDQDVIAELVAGADVTGLRANRVGYGDTAWSKRMLAHRAQNTAGGFSSAGLTPETLAGLLAVDRVHHTQARFQSSASAKTQIVGNKVLMFYADDNLSTEDPSSVKTFTSPTQSGGDYGVYVRNISTKLWEIVVEYYEKMALTSSIGIRQFTVS